MQNGCQNLYVSKALVVVDVQVCMFFGPWPVPDADGLLFRIANRVLSARIDAVPVVWVQNDGPEGELDAPGMPFWELALAPRVGELVVRKTTQDVFESNPELAQELQARGIDELEIVGLQSEMCLRASALGAKRAGFNVTVDRTLHGTYGQEGRSADEISDAVQSELEQELR